MGDHHQRKSLVSGPCPPPWREAGLVPVHWYLIPLCPRQAERGPRPLFSSVPHKGQPAGSSGVFFCGDRESPEATALSRLQPALEDVWLAAVTATRRPETLPNVFPDRNFFPLSLGKVMCFPTPNSQKDPSRNPERKGHLAGSVSWALDS